MTIAREHLCYSSDDTIINLAGTGIERQLSAKRRKLGEPRAVSLILYSAFTPKLKPSLTSSNDVSVPEPG